MMSPLFDKIKNMFKSQEVINLEANNKILSSQLAMSFHIIGAIEDLLNHEQYSNFDQEKFKTEILKLITINYNFAITGEVIAEENEKTAIIRKVMKTK